MSLKGQTCIVMGGSSGIGLATAKLLAADGAKVWITGRNEAKAKEAARSLGGEVGARAVDGTSDAAVRDFYREVGPFQHLVLALSGGAGGGPFRQLDAAAVRSGFEAKFIAHFLCAQRALDTLTEGGSITFVSAGSARTSIPGTAGLAAINGAIESMARTLALELAPTRVNVVSPGVIETPWWDRVPEPQRKAMLDGAAAASPLKRIGQAEDVADAIAFVVRNTFMTGTVIECDGGLRIK